MIYTRDSSLVKIISGNSTRGSVDIQFESGDVIRTFITELSATGGLDEIFNSIETANEKEKSNSMKFFIINNKLGQFTIIQGLDKTYSIYGSTKACEYEFKAIGYKPPNKYGNFSGREKAGSAACERIIKKHNLKGG